MEKSFEVAAAILTQAFIHSRSAHISPNTYAEYKFSEEEKPKIKDIIEIYKLVLSEIKSVG